MPEGSDKGSRGTIIVALITLAGTLGTALFANWGNIFPSRADPDSTTVVSAAGGEPNLVVEDWIFEPGTPVAGHRVRTSFTVKNEGSADAGHFAVEWYAVADMPNPTRVWQVPALAAGGEANLEGSFDGYRRPSPKLLTRLLVDPDDEVTESSDEDNREDRQLSVRRP